MNTFLKVVINVIIIYVVISPLTTTANGLVFSGDSIKSKKEQRLDKRKLFRNSNERRFFITAKAMYADLNSSVRFETPSGLFSTQIGLERHLGLNDKMPLLSGSFIWRITPRSGLFSNYYGLKRKNTITLEQDIIFLDDTLYQGSSLQGYFNTRVFGFGYLLTVLSEEKSFLGVYFNAYWIALKTGINSEAFNVDDHIGFQAPLPNFGIVAIFELTDWMSIAGSFGTFFLNVDGISGSFQDFHVNLSFKPLKCLGVDVGYQVFDVSASFPQESSFRTIMNYNYKGPMVGFTFRF